MFLQLSKISVTVQKLMPSDWIAAQNVLIYVMSSECSSVSLLYGFIICNGWTFSFQYCDTWHLRTNAFMVNE